MQVPAAFLPIHDDVAVNYLHRVIIELNIKTLLVNKRNLQVCTLLLYYTYPSLSAHSAGVNRQCSDYQMGENMNSLDLVITSDLEEFDLFYHYLVGIDREYNHTL